MEGVLACFDSENFFAFVHCWVHAYRNVPMGKKKKKENQPYLVLTKWQYHILCEIKIFYSSQMKEDFNNNQQTISLSWSKRRKRKIKEEEKKPQKQ